MLPQIAPATRPLGAEFAGKLFDLFVDDLDVGLQHPRVDEGLGANVTLEVPLVGVLEHDVFLQAGRRAERGAAKLALVGPFVCVAHHVPFERVGSSVGVGAQLANVLKERGWWEIPVKRF